MARGSINHLALTVTDLARSAAFYDQVLGFMGYTRAAVPEATKTAMKTALLAWASPHGAVTMRPAKGDSAKRAHDRNAPGLNHLAFNAGSRAEVGDLHALLNKIGAPVLDAPAEYAYFPGYYAVYFSDPDGIKIEFVHWPQG
ncbi:MAG: VOC family protein [Candidatus Binataceae bacterium]|nr:VOC family protein [Candidatus Binataceae bacterium]